jgi:hypothetical protein
MEDLTLNNDYDAPIRYNSLTDGLQRTRKTKYPWAQMKLNQNFFETARRTTVPQLQNKLAACARSWAKRHGLDWEFATQQEATGVRIWRTK